MATETRTPLSRERILRAGLAFADEHGIEALSMRKLGQELGFEAMSLYNHVRNKDDLLDGMLELVLAETEPPPADRPWDEAIRQSAISMNAALRRHRWAPMLLMTFRGPIRPRLEYMNALLGRLREAGFSADTTYHVYHVLDGHIFGYSIWENSHVYTPEQAEQMAGLLERFAPLEQELPHLWEHGVQHMTEGPHRGVSSFEYALDLILEGLRRMHAAEA